MESFSNELYTVESEGGFETIARWLVLDQEI